MVQPSREGGRGSREHRHRLVEIERECMRVCAGCVPSCCVLYAAVPRRVSLYRGPPSPVHVCVCVCVCNLLSEAFCVSCVYVWPVPVLPAQDKERVHCVKRKCVSVLKYVASHNAGSQVCAACVLNCHCNK